MDRALNYILPFAAGACLMGTVMRFSWAGVFASGVFLVLSLDRARKM